MGENFAVLNVVSTGGACVSSIVIFVLFPMAMSKSLTKAGVRISRQWDTALITWDDRLWRNYKKKDHYLNNLGDL
jgi:hypothetical protein